MDGVGYEEWEGDCFVDEDKRMDVAYTHGSMNEFM